MSILYFVTHPEVVIDPKVPIPNWPLSEVGVKRMRVSLTQPWLNSVDYVYSSAERKAVDGAKIVSSHLNIPFIQVEDLGEIDRSSTGYIGDEFWDVVDEFFRFPERSVRGWERATDAQRRIVMALSKLVGKNAGKNLLVVSHGAVGALLLAHYLNKSISRSLDQPGDVGGNYFVVDAATMKVMQQWKPIDEFM